MTLQPPNARSRPRLIPALPLATKNALPTQEGNMDQWWLALVPIAAAGFGYLAKRHVERSSRAEALRRRLQALALLRGLRREQATIADLDQIERDAS